MRGLVIVLLIGAACESEDLLKANFIWAFTPDEPCLGTLDIRYS